MPKDTLTARKKRRPEFEARERLLSSIANSNPASSRPSSFPPVRYGGRSGQQFNADQAIGGYQSGGAGYGPALLRGRMPAGKTVNQGPVTQPSQPRWSPVATGLRINSRNPTASQVRVAMQPDGMARVERAGARLTAAERGEFDEQLANRRLQTLDRKRGERQRLSDYRLARGMAKNEEGYFGGRNTGQATAAAFRQLQGGTGPEQVAGTLSQRRQDRLTQEDEQQRRQYDLALRSRAMMGDPQAADMIAGMDRNRGAMDVERARGENQLAVATQEGDVQREIASLGARAREAEFAARQASEEGRDRRAAEYRDLALRLNDEASQRSDAIRLQTLQNERTAVEGRAGLDAANASAITAQTEEMGSPTARADAFISQNVPAWTANRRAYRGSTVPENEWVPPSTDEEVAQATDMIGNAISQIENSLPPDRDISSDEIQSRLSAMGVSPQDLQWYRRQQEGGTLNQIANATMALGGPGLLDAAINPSSGLPYARAVEAGAGLLGYGGIGRRRRFREALMGQ